jgi:transposase InsO family protein
MEDKSMPWETSTVSDQRLAFVSRYMEDGFTSFAQLCREFGICTATGYRVLKRYDPDNPASLQDRSRRPLRPPSTDAEREAAIVGVRVDHPTWGPKKIRAYLQHDRPEMAWPVTSTIGAVLQRAGLVPSRRCRKRSWGGRPPLTRAEVPNQVWSIDFKGQFATQDGTLCYPLTLMDQSSRFLLRCQAYPGIASRDVRALLQAAFREFGLPACIRSDNGPPFASNAVAGLSALSVWWIRLGIRPETIQPSHPEQNGAHERLHRTLKAETTRPAAASIRAQQRLFDAFRDTYNAVRPHEALGQIPPANAYVRSQRTYPNRLPQIRYPDGLALRTVHRNGCIRWGGGEIFLSEVLIGETVAFEPLPGHRLLVWFAHLPLAVLDDRGPRWLHPSQARPVLEAFRARDTTEGGFIQQ